MINTAVEIAMKPGRYQVKERIQIPIQNINKGDYVSSFNFRDSKSYTRQVINTYSEIYDENLIIVSTDETKNHYTLNHKCIIKNDYPGYCVYLMKKNTGYRVGMSQLQPTSDLCGVGPYLRLRSENGDAVWILTIYETRHEALKAEISISTKFRIPQTMFTVKNEKSYFTQEELDDIWSDIDNENDAIKCLNHFGRNIKYPYFVSGLIHVSLKRPHETYACNILEHSMVRLRNNQWVTVNLQREYYNGIIHKIDVEREQLYFANGVLTHS